MSLPSPRPHKAPLPRRPPGAPAMPPLARGALPQPDRCAARGRPDAAGMPAGPRRTRGKGGSYNRCPERRSAAPHRGREPPCHSIAPGHRPYPRGAPPLPPGLPPRALHPPPPRRVTAAPAARRRLPQGGARDPQPGGLRSVGRELPDGRGRPVGMRQRRAGKKKLSPREQPGMELTLPPGGSAAAATQTQPPAGSGSGGRTPPGPTAAWRRPQPTAARSAVTPANGAAERAVRAPQAPVGGAGPPRGRAGAGGAL